MTEFSIDALIRQYIEAAKGYKEGILDPESSVADRYCEQIELIFAAIKSFGEAGFERLAELLNHQEEGVRLWASAHLLNYKQFNSLPVLQAVKDSGTVLSLVAEITLVQWRRGEIPY